MNHGQVNVSRRVGVGLVCGMLAMASSIAILTKNSTAAGLLGSWAPVVLVAGLVVVVGSVLAILTAFDRGRSRAVVRLDWFVPFLRRLQSGQQPGHAVLGRLMRRLLPAGLQSNWETKKRGWLRRWLRWLGISWQASPVRRIVQGVCLLAFLWLFFYVCWPYSARPAPSVPSSPGWTLQQIEQDSGQFVLQSPQPPTAERTPDKTPGEASPFMQVGRDVYVVDQSVNDLQRATVGRFRVASTWESSVYLEAAPLDAEGGTEASVELLESFLTSVGPWSLHPSDPHAWPAHYREELAAKEGLEAETFLMIDPLVSLSTAVASRSWVWSLVSAAIILIVCILIPRGFCGYLCPLGTTIDLFDWAIAGRVKRFRVPDEGWWVHTKYYVLLGTMVAAVCGVLVSGLFAAIPVITRGLLFLFEPLQNGVMRGWHLVPSMQAGQVLSLVLFFGVLCLGFLRPRFWCKYVCPSGAVFSLGNLFRVTERKVESSCINCNKCIEICPFDAIKPDYTTRVTDCTMCQSCGGVCPTHAIKFVERWNGIELKVENDPPTHETSIGRRGFLSVAAGTAAAVAGGLTVAGVTKTWGANLDDPQSFRPVRPPGSVPEREFLQMCIRCGECFKACPNNVLQPEGFQQGLEGLWAPMVVADWAGCESSCNGCGQVCPTGAIRGLTLPEKKVARMGLAIVNTETCLPFAGREECDLCVQECKAAGYDAIEYMQVRTEVDSQGLPLAGTGYTAPVVLEDKCVGCGLCQTRCYGINVKEKGLLSESAIIIEAGEGKEDRLMTGSYVQLRQAERDATRGQDVGPDSQPLDGNDFFVPDAPGSSTPKPEVGKSKPEPKPPPPKDPAENPFSF